MMAGGGPAGRRAGARGRAGGRTVDREAAGFTLIELLVALTLVGLISLVLFGGLRFGTRAWEAGTARADASRQIVVVRSLLRRQLSQAILPARPSAEDDGPAAFVGEPEVIRFIAPMSAHVGFGGLYLFELSIERAANRRRLMMRWQPYRADQLDEFDDAVMEERSLIDDIEAATFSYFGALGARDLVDWHDQWTLEHSRSEAAPMRLPELVSLRLEFPTGDRRRWPEMLVAPRGAILPEE